MKFQNLQAFEKHLQVSSLSTCYIIASSDADERAKCISYVTDILEKKLTGSELVSIKTQQDSFSKLIEALVTVPLFSSSVIVKVDDGSSWAKKEREQLASVITKPSGFSYLVLGVSSLKDFTSIYSAAKNDVVVLDMTQEKPWERQRRLQQWLIDRALQEGKKIAQPIAAHLLEACGTDCMMLEQELLKLITFVGQRPQITQEDMKAVGVNYLFPSGWQMAEALVFEGRAPIKDPSFDISDLLPLLGQVRYHINNARMCSMHLKEGKAKEAIAELMPQLKGASLDKYLHLAFKLRYEFFDEVMKILFKIELLSKNSSLSAPFLWDYLVAQIFQKRLYYAKTTTSTSSSQRLK